MATGSVRVCTLSYLETSVVLEWSELVPHSLAMAENCSFHAFVKAQS
jgi:hypothetical protein